MLEQKTIFISGQGGYHTYRIPALTVTTKGTILAFCEGRRDSGCDCGKIDLLLRRSADSGRRWSDVQVVAADGDMTCGDPCPVVDARDGTIWLPFCKNLNNGPEKMIIDGKAPRTIWMTKSADDGRTWATPWEITCYVKDPMWTWYATGPGHGIQLNSGRLIVPCDHVHGVNFNCEDPGRSHVIYSDDPAKGWRMGGVTENGTNECAAVELVDGALYLNCRNYGSERCRATAISRDGGESFCPVRRDPVLIEPVCEAGLVRSGASVLFSNPASREMRVRMTVRMSEDECRTWPLAHVLWFGPSAYSDLCVAPDGSIGCLYECGKEHPYETLTFARFDLSCMRSGTL